MTTWTDPQPLPDATEDEDVAAFWTRAARYGFVRPAEIDPDQAWFWTRQWIEGVIQVEIDIAKGRTTFYGSTEEFLASLQDRDAERSVSAADVRVLDAFRDDYDRLTIDRLPSKPPCAGSSTTRGSANSARASGRSGSAVARVSGR